MLELLPLPHSIPDFLFCDDWFCPLSIRQQYPARREALISPPSLVGKGAGGLGLALAFPHDVKSQLRVRSVLESIANRYSFCR
ncbi:hypothetical protein GSQ19_02605 [Trichormus variabilis 0441]|nr:hypothetical protein GSQ19_02605 [Trichormus variabilis 0441]